MTYDYISPEEAAAAAKTLDTKEEYKDLTSHEIVVLRRKFKRLGIMTDVVDHKDRLGLLRALLVHIENRDWWRDQYYLLKEKSGLKEDTWVQLDLQGQTHA